MPREILFRLTKKDFVIEAKTGHGPGGQNKNRRKTACRITHPPSGAVGQSQDQRQFEQNKRTAFRRLTETKKFKAWHNLEVARQMGHLSAAEDAADAAMHPKNLRVDVKKDGRWVPEQTDPS